MARDTLSVQKLTRNGATVSTGQTINPSNGIVIPAAGNTRNLWFEVRNTNGTIGTVTVKAGTNPPAFQSALGDVTFTVPATTGVREAFIDSARFAQDNGDIYLDFSANMAGTVFAYRLPDGY